MKEIKKYEKGFITEEALSEIAGGLQTDKEKLKNHLKNIGIPILAVAIGAIAIHKYNKKSSKKNISPNDDDFESILEGEVHPTEEL